MDANNISIHVVMLYQLYYNCTKFSYRPTCNSVWFSVHEHRAYG